MGNYFFVMPQLHCYVVAVLRRVYRGAAFEESGLCIWYMNMYGNVNALPSQWQTRM